MTEGLFVLTVIFVAYIICELTNDKKAAIKPALPIVDVEPPTISVVMEDTQKEPTKAPKLKTPPATKAKTTKQNTRKNSNGLKNPQTGEIATSYANYIFTKRWIKEALVTEGLLNKVYKNNELTPEIDLLIKAAIAKLETLEQYKI